MARYPKNRKSQLSDPRDSEWYPKTYIKETTSRSGRTSRRRYVAGNCEVCGLPHEMLWGNFSRSNRHPYRMVHLRCAQKVWNDEQARTRSGVEEDEVYEKIYLKYQQGAQRRGHSFDLSFDAFRRLLQQSCFYCGLDPTPHHHWKHVSYTGIDRMQNSQGYTIVNSVPCCTQCNFLKRDMEFQSWVDFLVRVGKKWANKQN